MDLCNFDGIVVHFERPENTKSGYDFLKKPNDLPGGGLQQQIVVVHEVIPLSKIVKSFFEAAGYVSNAIDSPSIIVATAVIVTALDLIKIKSFPDEYRSLLNLMKETRKGLTMDWDKVNNILTHESNSGDVLTALVAEQFLIKTESGRYIVNKKILTIRGIDFL